jgi:hypothetical protein
MPCSANNVRAASMMRLCAAVQEPERRGVMTVSVLIGADLALKMPV